MDTLIQLATYLAEVAILVIAILIVVGGILSLASKGKDKSKTKIKARKLNKDFEEWQASLEKAILSKSELKKRQKSHKKLKSKEKTSTLFLIDFNGDIRANAVEQLKDEVTAILTVAQPDDEVLVRIESGGGVVNGYGLGASQLRRFKDNNIPLTVCIDKVAASGGYLMACVANKIIASPFAIIGSIGVIAQIPNFHRYLKDKRIDFEQITAGEFKRTLTMFGENTAKGRNKMQNDIDEIHRHFKDYVSQNRPQVHVDDVATGEVWLGSKAFELRLVDKLITSDDYLLDTHPVRHIIKVEKSKRKSFKQKLSEGARSATDEILNTIQERQNNQGLY